MKQFLAENWIWLVNTIALTIVWFRKEIKEYFRYKDQSKVTAADIDTTNIQNLESTLRIYKDIIDDLIIRNESLRLEIEALRRRVLELETNINGH